MSEIKHMAKFSPSPGLCPECIRLLRSELKEAVLLHQSFFSIHSSSQSCSLCHLMVNALMGSLTVKNGPRSKCNLAAIIHPKPGQSTQIWGRRHMLDFDSLKVQRLRNYPISFIEVMMVKTDLVEQLAEKLGPSSTPQSTSLVNAWWGLKSNPDVFPDVWGCPYFWEYLSEVRKFRGRIDVTGIEKSGGFFWRTLNNTRPKDADVQGPYHRAVIDVSPLDHSPGWDGGQLPFDTDDQGDSGMSGIMGRLKQEKAPTTCGSLDRLELARRWREDCLGWHWKCESWQESHLFPSRVIDVGQPDGSQEPFLYVPAPSDSGVYICLSHRWGGAKVLQTVMGDPPGTPNGRAGTFSKFRSAIPMETMPKTFQDAVQVTRMLGYRYIWIDSLCIVQDRSSDWEAEAEKMGSYYRNAHLTLVAGSAVSADSGLFFPIKRPAVPCHIGSVSLELQDCMCEIHGAEPHTFPLFASEPQMFRGHLESSTRPPGSLDERAWVLQEEVLSARSLIFTDGGLYWECAHLSASESHPHGSEHQHMRSLSSAGPESYRGEIFFPTGETYAQLFKEFVLIGQHESWDLDLLAPTLVSTQFMRSLLRMFKGEVRIKFAYGPQTLASDEIQTPENHDPRSEKRQQDLEFDEEHANLTASVPGPSPTHLARAGASEDAMNAKIVIWHRLVEEYSARHLTRESDRLIAIQGLASTLGKVRNDRYYAGLWGSTLREDMLWMAQDRQRRLKHWCDCISNQPYILKDLKPRRRLDESESWQAVAPSWSWASADQCVAFVHPTDKLNTLEYFFRLLGVTLDDDTALFNVQGRLKLEGVLRPIGLAPLRDELPHEELFGSLYNPSDPSKKEIGYWIPDRKTSKNGVMVCIPLVMMPLGLYDSGCIQDKAAINCLVLEPTEKCFFRNKASRLLEFRRMGWATFDIEYREFLGLGVSKRMKDNRPWDVRVKEWTRKPVVMDII